MSALLSLRTWLGLTLIWIALVAAFAWQTWPRVPFDINPNDPVTRAALQSAVNAHVGLAALWAVLIPLMALVLGRYLRRRS